MGRADQQGSPRAGDPDQQVAHPFGRRAISARPAHFLDAIELLAKLLESAGFAVVSALIPDVRDGHCDVDGMMRRHDPAVVIYDLGPPYERNWALFQQLRARTSMRDRRFVITAVNASRVEVLAGQDERIYEVVDTQRDLGEIVQAVKEAARARVIRPQQPASNVTVMPERRFHSDRRQTWTSNDIYRKLREKREEVESERRRRGRRATDHGPDHSHAA